jgi:hypothetical protein
MSRCSPYSAQVRQCFKPAGLSNPWPPNLSSYLSFGHAVRPWRSTPHPLLTGLTVGVVLIGLIIPLTPLGAAFGFQEPPLGFYLFLIGAIAVYLVLVEAVKGPLYRHARTHTSQTEGWRLV